MLSAVRTGTLLTRFMRLLQPSHFLKAPRSIYFRCLVCQGVLLLLCTLMTLNAKEGHADYFAIVRNYAETMLDQNKGRDHFGPQPSPLFATVLDRRTYEIPGGRVEDLVRARVSQENKSIANPHYDENLLQVLYALSRVTGDAHYAAEADRTMEYFLKHCQEERYGFYTWGEHVGWDLTTESLGGYPKDKPSYAVHEFWRPWIYWDKSFQMAPEQCQKFAHALWDHQIDHSKPGMAWSRHAQLLDKVSSRRGYEFPRHGGFYIATWAHAYKQSHDPAMLADIEAVVDFFIGERDPTTGAIPHCSSIANWLRPESTVSLAISLWDSIPLVPEKLGAKMRGLAESIDDVFLKLPHDPGPGGKGLVLTATLDLKTTDLWLLESGKWVTSPPEGNVLPPRHKAYTEGWVSAYVGPVPHSTLIGYCIERHRQVQSEGYKNLIVRTADGYMVSTSEIEPRVENGKQITPRVDTGTIGRVIGLMNYAWRLTGDPKYLERAEWFCDWAAEHFWGDGLPLPIPSVPFSEKQNFYSASARSDTLAMGMLETWLLRNKPEMKIEFRWTDL